MLTDVWSVRPGVAADAVEQELAALTASLRQRHPDHIWEGETLPSGPGGYATMGKGTSRGTGAPPPDTAPVLPATESTDPDFQVTLSFLAGATW